MRRRLAAGVAVLLAGTAGLGIAGSGSSISLVAQPTIAGSTGVVALTGRISSPKTGELVTVLGRECGVPGAVLRALVATQTADGGFYTVDFRPRSKTVIRATWDTERSADLTVQVRAYVALAKRPPNGYRVSASGTSSFDGKRITIERFDRNASRWRAVQTVVVHADSYGEFAEKDHFKIAVPKGTTLRAVLPLAQAKPCYLAGYSKLIRT